MTTPNTERPGFDLDKLEALAKAATPQNFDSAQIQNQGHIECPTCDGSGEVELTADYCNYDGRAIGVQFYGIGPEHRAAEAFYRAANPQAVQQLIALARSAITQQAEASQAGAADTTASASGLLNSDELAAFNRFCECAEDFDSGGHDVDKEMMAKLARIGVVRSTGFGRHETTAFGDMIRDGRATLAPVAAQQAAAPECSICKDTGYYADEYRQTEAGNEPILLECDCGGELAAKAPAAQAVDATVIWPSEKYVHERIATLMAEAGMADSSPLWQAFSQFDADLRSRVSAAVEFPNDGREPDWAAYAAAEAASPASTPEASQQGEAPIVCLACSGANCPTCKANLAAPAAQQGAPTKPRGWLAGDELFYASLAAAQRSCDAHNAYERSRPDFDEANLLEPEPVYSAVPTTAGMVEDAKDAAPEQRSREWQPVTGPGQLRKGDKLRFKIGDKTYNERAKLILHSGTNKEEVIYDKGRNFYFITSMVMSGKSNHKCVEFLAAQQAQTSAKNGEKATPETKKENE